MASSITLKALGLNTSPNQLEVPEGSLTNAKNIIIRRDNIIESRRGFKLFGPLFGNEDDRAKQLLVYKDRILRHYNTTLSFQDGVQNDGTANFTDFSGDYEETEEGLRIKSIEANKNFYFTTAAGIKKISAKFASDLSEDSDFIVPAGGIKALDLVTRLSIVDGDVTGFLPVDSTVAYRTVWGSRDRNDNLIRGTPSERSEIYAPFLTFIVRDFNRLLGALDDIDVTNSLINDGNYVSSLGLTNSSTATNARTNAIALAEKIDEDILYAASATAPLLLITNSAEIDGAICYVGFDYSSSPVDDYLEIGSLIFLDGFSPAAGTLDEDQTVLGVNYNNKSFLFSDVNTGTDVITLNAHGFNDGDLVTFNGSDLPDGLVANTIYWIISSSLNDFQVSATRGGAAVDLIDQGSGTHNIESNYLTFSTAASGAVTLSSATIVSNEYRSITEPVALSVIPTHAQLESIQDYISDIIFELQNEPIAVIPGTERATYIDILDITTTCNVELTVTIPQDITNEYFLQVYRSATVTATGTDVLTDFVPSDELQLVYEAFPTAAEIAAGSMTFIDITPDDFRGENLYTNAATGEGILQSNDIPPFAKDIALFRNYAFYANTQTRHRKFINLLGVTQLKSGGITNISATNPAVITSTAHGLSDGDLIKILNTNSDTVNGFHKVSNSTDNTFEIPVDGTGAGNLGYWTDAVLEIANGDEFNEYSFVAGAFEISTLVCPIQADVPVSGYFLLNSALDLEEYYFWYDTTGSDPDPAVSDRIGVRIDVSALTTATEVATKTKDILNRYSYDFSASSLTDTVTITNTSEGPSEDIELGAGMGAAGFTVAVTTQGRGENLKQEITDIETVADVAGSLIATAVLLNSPFNRLNYYFWFRVSGTGTDPLIPGRSGVQVDIDLNDSDSVVAEALKDAINTLEEFSAEATSNVVTVMNVGFGDVDDAMDYISASPGFTYTVIQEGALEVLLSQSISPTIASEETAKSLVRAINKNDGESVYAYYLSGVNDVSGQMLFESRDLVVDSDPFYVVATNDALGASFNPDLSPEFEATSITAADNTVITVANHGLVNGDTIVIIGSNSYPSVDGIHEVSNTTTNTFTIPVEVTVAGTIARLSSEDFAEFSENETKPNRIYFSKLQQPEAVPIVNFIDVGPEDKEILRIIPLRSSLFIFKKDGLYRLSGELAPFNVEQFDNSLILLAPDSVGIVENIVYCWTNAGISQISESGTATISRPIDNIILRLASNNFPNFRTNTFGIGYDSDQSYIVWTIQRVGNDVATIAYRYNTLTRSWTTFDKTNTCVLLHPAEDVLYLGGGDVNSLEVERKTFSRLDYADYEIISNLDPGLYFSDGEELRIPNVTQYNIGDVLTQVQYLTIYAYNSLLRKLDNDPGPADDDYESLLEMVGGDDIRGKIEALAQKLDLDANIVANDFESSIDTKTGIVANASGHTIDDPTVITSVAHGLVTGRIINIQDSTSTPTLDGNHEVTVINANTFTVPVAVTTLGSSGDLSWTTQDSDFRDVKTCFNVIIDKLNEDTGVAFSSYTEVDTSSLFEAVIIGINKTTNSVFLSTNLPFMVGPLTIYKAIETEFQYAPQTMGDTLGYKHLREATIMFENKAFTVASLAFASDLFPAFVSIEFEGDGSGLFGNEDFGEGFFGGESHGAPFRTYIPRTCQRCRYILVRFSHMVARERYNVYGITLTGEVGLSTRAYKT